MRASPSEHLTEFAASEASRRFFYKYSRLNRRLLAEAERLQLSFRLDKKALRQADVALNSELVTKGVVFGAAGCPLPELAIPVKPWTWLQTQYDPYAYHWASMRPSVRTSILSVLTTGSIILSDDSLEVAQNYC